MGLVARSSCAFRLSWLGHVMPIGRAVSKRGGLDPVGAPPGPGATSLGAHRLELGNGSSHLGERGHPGGAQFRWHRHHQLPVGAVSANLGGRSPLRPISGARAGGHGTPGAGVRGVGSPAGSPAGVSSVPVAGPRASSGGAAKAALPQHEFLWSSAEKSVRPGQCEIGMGPAPPRHDADSRPLAGRRARRAARLQTYGVSFLKQGGSVRGQLFKAGGDQSEASWRRHSAEKNGRRDGGNCSPEKPHTFEKHATSITIALDETKTRKVLLLRHAQTPVYCPRVWVSVHALRALKRCLIRFCTSPKRTKQPAAAAARGAARGVAAAARGAARGVAAAARGVAAARDAGR